MKFFVAALVMAATALAQTINTPPALTTCVPVLLQWNGGQAPYFLSVLPGGQASGSPLKAFGQIAGTSTTWVVDIAAGTSITLALTDSSGQTVYSSPVTIQAGTSTSCVGGGSSAQTIAASSTAAFVSSVSSEASVSSSSSSSSSAAALSSSSSSASKEASSSSSSAAAATSTPASSNGEKAILSAGALVLAAVLPLFA